MKSTSRSPNRDRGSSPYDEERLEWTPLSRCWGWPKKYLRLGLPRGKKVAFYIAIIDILIVGILLHLFGPLITLLVRNEEMFGARLTLPLVDPPSMAGLEDRKLIPRILHQTAATTNIPAKWVAGQQSCVETFKDYEYMMWTDDSAREFIAKNYSWFIDTWDNYPFPIQRADAIRYFILYHYGGIYLDMDTICNRTFPLHQIEADRSTTDFAVFKSTVPTGVTNDMMITTPRHPLFAAALSRLVVYNDITKLWAHWLPYVAIMIAAGPMFITMAIKNWLLSLPSVQTPSFQVIRPYDTREYITDLESCSWHQGDAGTLMFIGRRPWIWYAMGAVGLSIGLYIINMGLQRLFRGSERQSPRHQQNPSDEMKFSKLI